ncbi:MAG: DUF2207 family protein [Candidatus Njordarchaeia archaeon]
MIKQLSLALILLIAISPLGLTASSNISGLETQGGNYYISFYNTTVVVNNNASLSITETVSFSFTSGTFHYAYRYIYFEKIDDVLNVKVGEISGNSVNWYTYGEHPNGYIVSKDPMQVTIKWFYPKTTGFSQRTFIIKYLVTCAVGADGNKNFIYWTAVPSEHPSVSLSHVTVVIPKTFSKNEIETNPNTVSLVNRDGKTILSFSKNHIMEGYPFVVSVKFPKFIEPRFSYRRYFNENYGLITILLILLSIFSLYILYIENGKPPSVPKYKIDEIKRRYKEIRFGVDNPPKNITPAQAAVLMHSSVSSKVWLALILDLASRGYLVIKQNGKEKNLVLTEKALNAIGNSKAGDLLDFEREFLDTLNTLIENNGNVGEKAVSFSDFYSYILAKKFVNVDDALVKGLIDDGYFKTDFRKFKKSWGIKIGLLFLPFVALIIFSSIFYILGLFIVGIAGALGFPILALIAYSIFTTLTEKGVLVSKEAEIYSKFLSEKMEKAKTLEDIESIYKPILNGKFAWVILTRFKRRGAVPFPKHAKSTLKTASYWLPVWLIITSPTNTETLNLNAALNDLNKIIRGFVSSALGGMGGFGGGFGGGFAGGGGIGAG